jgi:hypothetical protein
MSKPVDYSYSADRNRRAAGNAEYKRFNQEYFSGQDARIYFGNTWVDEIVAIQFSLQQNTAPIFGYASYTYDRMAVGSRQVTGTFRINFKESYYLHFITNSLELELESLKKKTNSSSSTKKTLDVVSPEHMLSVSAGNTDKFEELAYQFEQSLWGNSSSQAMNARAQSRGEQDWFAPADSRPNLAKQGFTIEFMYGPYAETYSRTATTESVATTAHTLTGVYLTGVNQIVDYSGQPIYEEYSFIAKDLDGNVNVYDSDPQYAFGKRV